MEIEEFDEEIIQALQDRAKEVIQAKKEALGAGNPEQDLLDLELISEEMAWAS